MFICCNLTSCFQNIHSYFWQANPSKVNKGFDFCFAERWQVRHSICTQRFSVASLLCYECDFFQNMFICCNLTSCFQTSTLTSGKRTRRRSTRDLISASPKGGKCGIQFAHKRFSVASLLCYECDFFQNMFICCNLTKLFPKHPLLLLASEPVEDQLGIWFLLRRKVASAAFNLHTNDFPSHRFSVTNVWLQRMEKCAMICNAVRVSQCSIPIWSLNVFFMPVCYIIA